MVELIEFEDKDELDCFIEVMIMICKEIKDIENGYVDCEDNLLKNVLYMVDCIINQNWNYLYMLQEVVYLVVYLKEWKYWVLVCWVDNVYGDCNFICSCLSVESYVYVE